LPFLGILTPKRLHGWLPSNRSLIPFLLVRPIINSNEVVEVISKAKSLRQKIGQYIVDPLFIKPDYAITSSNHTRLITERSYNVREDQVIEVGTPKIDFLLSSNNEYFYLENEDTVKEWTDFRGKK